MTPNESDSIEKQSSEFEGIFERVKAKKVFLSFRDFVLILLSIISQIISLISTYSIDF